MERNSSVGSDLRAGIVGIGEIGHVHLDALRRLGIPVTAVAASSAESAARASLKLGIPTACASVDHLVARDDVDVVHVCTPNALHARHVETALAHGKHVVCEKPLAVSSGEASRLLVDARRSGLIHAVAYNYRFYPMVGAMRAMVAQGRLGHVHLVRGAYLADFVLTLKDPHHWLLDPALVGPALVLADIGVHWWDLAEHVSGQRATAVLCTYQSARDRTAWGEDSAALMLRMDGGAVASAVVSSAAAGHGNTIELDVVGTAASMHWAQEQPDRLRCRHLGEPEHSFSRPQGLDGWDPPNTLQLPRGHPQGYLDGFRDFLATVYAQTNASQRVAAYPDFADGLWGVQILEALLESARAAEWVILPERLA